MNWNYWYIFPYAMCVATIANASGFSGAVLFQPFFIFSLQLPIHESIATGVATETAGMSSGASRYMCMEKVDLAAARKLLPTTLGGVAFGLFVFSHASAAIVRLIVGLVIATITINQLYNISDKHLGVRRNADLAVLDQHRWVSFLAGNFSACTGTGVAEMHAPLLEHKAGLARKRANATAILMEAVADWAITAANFSLGNLRPDILLFSLAGALVGAQLGALWSPHVADRLLKIVFAACVLGIGAVYVSTSLANLLAPSR